MPTIHDDTGRKIGTIYNGPSYGFFTTIGILAICLGVGAGCVALLVYLGNIPLGILCIGIVVFLAWWISANDRANDFFLGFAKIVGIIALIALVLCLLYWAV